MDKTTKTILIIVGIAVVLLLIVRPLVTLNEVHVVNKMPGVYLSSNPNVMYSTMSCSDDFCYVNQRMKSGTQVLGTTIRNVEMVCYVPCFDNLRQFNHLSSNDRLNSCCN